ncbi:unnamed protein product [Hanseniaspora opuntiae]
MSTYIEKEGEGKIEQFEVYKKFFYQISDNYKQRLLNKLSNSNSDDPIKEEDLDKLEESLNSVSLLNENLQAEVMGMYSKSIKDKQKKEDVEIDTGFRTFERIFSIAVENKWI